MAPNEQISEINFFHKQSALILSLNFVIVLYKIELLNEMKNKKIYEEESPTKLKTTQSILENLYARVTKPDKHMIQSFQEKQNHPYLSTISQKSQTNIQARLQAMIPNRKIHSYEEPQHECSLSSKIMPIKSRFQQRQSTQHEHSSNCCIFDNKMLKSKIQGMQKQQALLQSYRQQVQYLKKMNLLQTQEIDKLRRMNRIQEKKGYFSTHQQSESKLTQSVIQIPNKDTKVYTDKVSQFEKNNNKKKSIRNSLGNKSRRVSQKGTSKKKQYF